MTVVHGPAGRLRTERLGAGDPVSVWVHGLTGSLDEIRPLAAHTTGSRVLMDLRGHGASESPPESAGYDHPAMRLDVEAVADAVRATCAFGVSTGAGAILNLLADRPDRFERVVLLLPASIDGANPAAPELYLPLATDLETMPLAELAERQAKLPNQLFEARPYWRDLVRERTLRMNATGIPRALRAYARGRPPVADPNVLSRVRAPVLLLAHEDDPVHDVAHARQLAAILPNAELRVWPENLAMYDDLDAFARLIAAFLKG